MLLNATNISKTLGLKQLFIDVTVSIEPGDRIGVIGPNGAGKSTLLKVLAGLMPPDSGQINMPPGLRAVYVPQDDTFDPGKSPREIVTAYGGTIRAENRYRVQGSPEQGRRGARFVVRLPVTPPRRKGA